jgi:hypothetical protein
LVWWGLSTRRWACIWLRRCSFNRYRTAKALKSNINNNEYQRKKHNKPGGSRTAAAGQLLRSERVPSRNLETCHWLQLKR